MDANRRAADAYRRAGGFVKETAAPMPPALDVPNGASETTPAGGPDREDRTTTVAAFLALLGRDEAAGILRRMPAADAERVVARIPHVGEISPSRARRLLARFGTARPASTRPAAAGPETARELLVRAFGVEEGERRFYALLPEERPHRFSFLDDADGHQLAMMIRNESVATLAVLLAHVTKPVAARLLAALPDGRRSAAVRRMAELDAVDTAVLESVETTLRDRMESVRSPAAEEIDGEDHLARILRFLDLTTGDRILAEVRTDDAELADRVERRLTTFEDVLQIGDRELQRVLRGVDDIDLAIVLKGKRAAAVARVEANVSDRRRVMIREQRETLGPMPRRDVDRATADFIRLVREMAATGEIGGALRG